MTRTRDTRFAGSGNTWVADGHYRGWKVVCCRCGASKTITHHHGSTLPSSAIIKKLAQAGWYIGNKECHDVCAECRRKPKRATTQPHHAANGSEQASSELLVQLRACLQKAQVSLAAYRLGEVKTYIANAVREIDRIVEPGAALSPTVTPESEPPITAPLAEQPPLTEVETIECAPESDSDYQSWLAELDRAYRKVTNAKSNEG